MKTSQHLQRCSETGIKVVDLLCPYQKGGKIGLSVVPVLVRRVLIQELIRNIGYRAWWILSIQVSWVERTGEGNDLYYEMRREPGVLPKRQQWYSVR